MIESLALMFSLLALLIALWALLKVQKEKKAHEEQMAASLEALLDEWEAENRRFVDDLERLQRQLLRQMRTAEEPAAGGSVVPPPVFDAGGPVPEKPAEAPTASTFQKLLEEVLAMKKEGKTDSEIARQMNRGVGEIQFILQSAAFQKKNRT
jgi:hypothetical protein